MAPTYSFSEAAELIHTYAEDHDTEGLQLLSEILLEEKQLYPLSQILCLSHYLAECYKYLKRRG